MDALEKLYHLELNQRQLSALLKLAKKTAAKMPAAQEVQANTDYRNALKSLHDALLSQEEERIEELSEQLDELQEKKHIAIDDEFEYDGRGVGNRPAGVPPVQCRPDRCLSRGPGR